MTPILRKDTSDLEHGTEIVICYDAAYADPRRTTAFVGIDLHKWLKKIAEIDPDYRMYVA